MVKGEGDTWWVIDNATGGLKNLQDWNAFWQDTSLDGKLRLYVTEPQKFTAPLDKYSTIMLGTNLKRKKDWYQGYFKDMIKWFRKGPDLATLGLPTTLKSVRCENIFSNK